MNITISCKLVHSSTKFNTIQSVYKQLEDFANTKIDNPLYALCFEKFSDKINTDMLQNVFTNNTTKDEEPYISINLSNELLSKSFLNKNIVEEDNIIITQFIHFLEGDTYRTDINDSIYDNYTKACKSRFNYFNNKLNEVIDTLKELGFAEVLVNIQDKDDLSFLKNDNRTCTETQVQKLANIMSTFTSPKIKLYYKLNINIKPISSIRIKTDTDTETFRNFVLAYTDFYNKMSLLLKQFNDVCYAHTKDDINEFINLKYKDMYDIFYNNKVITDSFNFEISNYTLSPIIDIYHHSNTKNTTTNDAVNIKIKKFNLNYSRTQTAELKHALEFYYAFNTTMTQFKEKYGDTFDNINANLTFYFNKTIFKLSGPIQNNTKKIKTKINELILESLAELDNYK